MLRRCSILLTIGTALLAAACRAPEGRSAALTVTDDWGRAVALTAPARRIVSLAPATTELVFALGLGDRLVGRTHWCDYPAAARAVTDVGNGLGPSVEVVAARRPDLVLLYASEANRPAQERLDAMGIPVAVLRSDRADDVRRLARVIATLAGHSRRGDSLVAAFDAALADASRGADEGSRPRVYLDIESNPPITIGRGSYLHEIVTAAGADNVFGDIAAPSAPVGLEVVVARRPDVILSLAADSGAAAMLVRRPGWGAVAAVRASRIVTLDPSLFGRPSPRMPQAVRRLRSQLMAVTADTDR